MIVKLMIQSIVKLMIVKLMIQLVVKLMIAKLMIQLVIVLVRKFMIQMIVELMMKLSLLTLTFCIAVVLGSPTMKVLGKPGMGSCSRTMSMVYFPGTGGI